MKRTPNVIAAGIDQWLRREVVTSSSGQNRVRDNHADVRSSYLQPDGPDALKTSGHYDRFRHLLEQYPALSGDDRFIARLIHHALMFVSGSARTQWHLQASTQEEYAALRFGRIFEYNGAAGINILRAVHEGIALFKKFGPEDVSSVAVCSHAMNRMILDGHNRIFEWHMEHPERATEALAIDEGPVPALLACQEISVQLTAAHISFTARCRGGLEHVPVLEPKSISEVSEEPLYPFRQQGGVYF